MKKSFYVISSIIALTFIGCDYYEGDTYDFSNTADKYIEIKTKTAQTGKRPGETAKFTIQSRETWTENVIYNYKFNGVPGRDTLKFETNSKDTKVTIPNDILGSNPSLTVKFELINATTQKTGRVVSIGRFGADKEFVNVTIVP